MDHELHDHSVACIAARLALRDIEERLALLNADQRAWMLTRLSQSVRRKKLEALALSSLQTVVVVGSPRAIFRPMEGGLAATVTRLREELEGVVDPDMRECLRRLIDLEHADPEVQKDFDVMLGRR